MSVSPSILDTVSTPQPNKTGIRRPRGIDIDHAKLAALRTDRLMTRQELAAAAEVTPIFIAKLEVGERQPSLKTLRALCAALDCQPADLKK